MKKPIIGCVFVIITALFASCNFKSDEDLFYLPRIPIEYSHLKNDLQQLISSGMSYAPPVSGNNRQTVQVMDLDGDGREEYLVFLKENKAPVIIVFTKQGDSYAKSAVISGDAEYVECIAYADINNDGTLEIITGWNAGGVLKALTVHTFQDGVAHELLSTPYHEYALYEMGSDGNKNLLVINLDPSQITGSVDMYGFEGMELEKASTGPLSDGVEMIKKVRTGLLHDRTPAIFVASQYQTNYVTTDVLIYKDGALVNISLNESTSVSDENIRGLNIYADDVNQDGVLDLPKHEPLPNYDPQQENVNMQIIWRNYDSSGRVYPVGRTYHSLTLNWYLLLPERWYDKITVTRNDVLVGERITTFAIVFEDGSPPLDILNIYNITKVNGRDIDLAGRTLLNEKSDSIILSEFLALPAKYSYMQLSEDELMQAFNIVQSEW